MADGTLHYVGNFNAEKGQLSSIDRTITDELELIEEQLLSLGQAWKDEKSAKFIKDANAFLADIRVKKTSAIKAGNNILDQVENALRIYNS